MKLKITLLKIWLACFFLGNIKKSGLSLSMHGFKLPDLYKLSKKWNEPYTQKTSDGHEFATSKRYIFGTEVTLFT